MAWLEPVATAVTAAELANKLAKSSNLIRKHWSRVCYWIRHGNAVVPVFGAGGVGKSTLGRVITGDADPLDVAAPYEESWITEPISLTGDIPGKLLVGPGQISRAARHWPDLFNEVTSGTTLGVINVVSYGLHSLAIRSYQEHDLWQPNMSVDAFMDAYRINRRAVELEMLRSLIAGIRGSKATIWMITVVNKQDLWWDRRMQVREFYEQGDYGDAVRELQASLGERHFQHEFIPLSLTLGNLTSPSAELLAPTCAGYDQSLHLQYLQTFFGKLYELLAQGASA